jgi:uncharacterized RDD family membrane protein YckC
MNGDGCNLRTATYYPQRFLARVIDLLLVTLVSLSLQAVLTTSHISTLQLFLGYSLTCIFFHQPTLGKYLFLLKVDSAGGGGKLLFRQIVRELLFLLLLPLLFLNLVCGSDKALHDRICNTTVVGDGLKYS